MEDAPFGAFHRRLALFSCGGPFCDGYILGIIAIALEPLAAQMRLTPAAQGLIGGATLIGMCIGGALLGFLTDLLGRRTMYTLDLLLLVVLSLLQLWADNFAALFVLRLGLGVAIGADYPIASALMAEFAPKRHRGLLLSAMIGGWWLGYAISFLVSYALSSAHESAWQWMLASSAVPAAIVVALRWGMPESPQWLASKGRKVEAQAVITKYLGNQFQLADTPIVATRYRRIFEAPYLGRTAFVCAFWSCQIIPTFGIYTFAPELLRALGSPDPLLGTAILSSFFLAGVIPAALLVDRVGRRPLLILPFALTGGALLMLAYLPRTAVALVIINLLIFTVFNAGSSVLQWVYPSELFPTDVRATALGFATAVSRIGAALGTFLVPLGFEHYGVNRIMLIFATICAIGWLTAWMFAPETRELSLSEAGGTLPTSH